MTRRHNRAAIYLRVSRDDQTAENQRLVLARVAEHRGWIIVQTYEDQGISGAKGRDQRPAFDQMLKDIVRRKFDWSFDRLDANHGFGGYLDDRTTIAFAGLIERELGGFTPPRHL